MTVVVGVVADTHVPERVEGLHPGLLDALREEGVQAILHAGDISLPWVLDELKSIAPVVAVRGNRDLLLKDLPLYARMSFNGVPVVLMHGHGGWVNYLVDKVFYWAEGYRLGRYWPILLKTAPEARVIVFGHTHCRENLWHEGRLIFNPGSTTRSISPDKEPSFGILRFEDDGQVTGEVIKLPGYKLSGRRWQACNS